jgi:hypothetical protein
MASPGKLHISRMLATCCLSSATNLTGPWTIVPVPLPSAIPNPSPQHSKDVTGRSRVVTGRVTGRCSEKARLYWFVTVSRLGAGEAPICSMSNSDKLRKPSRARWRAGVQCPKKSPKSCQSLLASPACPAILYCRLVASKRSEDGSFPAEAGQSSLWFCASCASWWPIPFACFPWSAVGGLFFGVSLVVKSFSGGANRPAKCTIGHFGTDGTDPGTVWDGRWDG